VQGPLGVQTTQLAEQFVETQVPLISENPVEQELHVPTPFVHYKQPKAQLIQAKFYK